jgi:hypothetical protein
MDSQKNKLLEETYDRIIYIGCCIKPYEDLSDIIADDIMIFGTAKDEQLFSFVEIDQLFKSQYLQMENMQPSVDRKRLFKRISSDENTAIIIEELRLSFGLADKVNTILMRASATMEYIENVWKLTHWHASTAVNTENDPWHFEEWKHEKEKLQQLVDEQTASLIEKNRELEIEAALERVRASAMAMHTSEQVGEAIDVLFEEVKMLDMNTLTIGLNVILESEEMKTWTAKNLGSKVIFSGGIIDMKGHPATQKLFTDWKKQLPISISNHEGNEVKGFYEYIYNQPGHVTGQRKDLPERMSFTNVIIPEGSLMVVSVVELSEDELGVLKRFANVFSITYRRFLDLQKAEYQAKKAKIELSLERIRAQVTAMKESSDLFDIVVSMRTEFLALGHKADYFWHMQWRLIRMKCP